MANKWKDIWNNRNTDLELIDMTADEFTIYSKLKELDGYDVVVNDKEAYYKSFYQSALNLWEYMQKKTTIHSVYEVGCGSGANLYLLKNRDIKTGGIDYSEKLANVAQKILGEDGNSVTIGEAVTITADEKWDVVLSEGVFAYFPDEVYGQVVLEKMYEKANKAVIILEIFDKDLQSKCEQHRKESMPDYEEKYKDLDKIFYPRNMFERFAADRHSKIEFTKVNNDYYWNSKYFFNCIIYKE